jgi:MGT family glycosyltransferase
VEQRHVAILTSPAVGHVYPYLGLCRELVKRGYRVTYPTNERFAVRVREAGANTIGFNYPELRYADKISQYSSDEDSGFWRWFTIYGPLFLATAAAMVAELEEPFTKNPPDLILYERFIFGGRILAQQLNCPAIQVCSHFALRDFLLRVDGVGTNPEPMLAFAHLLDSFMSTYGVKGKDQLWHVEEINLVFIPREFQYDSHSFDHRFKFVGATHQRKPRTAVWKNRAENGEPLILISENTGSVDHKFLKLCIEAFVESQYHIVFSKGEKSPEVPATELPSNFEINREALNCDIIPFANAMVCQGGMGTVLESLYHGVPVVAVPPHPFNSEVAYRVAELGLGVHIPERGITAEVLREAVNVAAFDEALLDRVRRMQKLLSNSSGAIAAADTIEEFLAEISGAKPRVNLSPN